MKEWICREMSTSTGCDEKGILMIEKELIRCKDCKYWVLGRCYNANNGDGAKYYRAPIKSEDGYCDWAERK